MRERAKDGDVLPSRASHGDRRVRDVSDMIDEHDGSGGVQ
ncbi:MAG: hypothetical protein KatS3mg038_3194 [Candidatus Kapaibacterium sp.]|nr:MAG: hypothetical protein KatS3mg038_0369 [Candidatus Kapabacteria bacterium]GIV51142.1 MAG: hypothetical protein KatS3mg038_1663 [Candidatus Kapabacteria bacterium]GIV52562.1 MAG: hypothetical protein KatS3mg038_3083 [Candidatus Kapabacteria bacterium]GIV52673.1 MAG: hypothetical protein KatS3mg038_3194 [Candidatus Kapabacteria bacterium]